MYTVPRNINSGSKPQEACSNKPLIAVSKITQPETQPCENGYVCLKGRLLCSLHVNVFNTGMPPYLVQQWPSTAGLLLLQCTQQETVGLIGQI